MATNPPSFSQLQSKTNDVYVNAVNVNNSNPININQDHLNNSKVLNDNNNNLKTNKENGKYVKYIYI